MAFLASLSKNDPNELQLTQFGSFSIALLYNTCWHTRLVMNLHLKSKGTICFRNLLLAALTISTGVKQGDPSAMQLFILGYDPLIKFISASLSPIEHILLPYCDDVAIAIANVVDG